METIGNIITSGPVIALIIIIIGLFFTYKVYELNHRNSYTNNRSSPNTPPIAPPPPAAPANTAATAPTSSSEPWWKWLLTKVSKHWVVSVLIVIFGIWIVLKAMTWVAPSVSRDTISIFQSSFYTVGNTWNAGKIIQDSIENKEKERTGDYVPKTIGGKDDISMDGNTTIHTITLHRGKKYGPVMIQNSNIGLRAIGAELWCSQGDLILKKGDQAPSNGAKWQSGEWYFSAEKYFIQHPESKTYSFTLKLTPNSQ